MAEENKTFAQGAENAATEGERLETGTYEIIKKRLGGQADELRGKLAKLNAARKEVFGSIENTLIANDRINTENNCTPRDMAPVGKYFIFGYNVLMGLKTETVLSDVFAVYEFAQEENSLKSAPLDIIADKRFEEDFKSLYKYYKNTVFVKFSILGPKLYMVFQIGKSLSDIKTFKFAINNDGSISYIDNRSEHEFKFPPQHEFEWKRTTRDMHKMGKHPHVSILDRVFVETVGGDLTIKVEDNTETGLGVFSEPVENKQQRLEDGEIQFADLGNIILLKILPYQEKKHRYIVFNDKTKEAIRIDSIQDSCVLLPDGQGIVFADGYYLQTGEHKQFDTGLADMRFEKKMASPNGEDFMYVFYNLVSGHYVLLSYNIIAQKVDSPISCNGYSLFPNGKMLYFREEPEPVKHHLVQVWQTTYMSAEFEPAAKKDTLIYKIGNKDIVRAMAECTEVLLLLNKGDSYRGLYWDLVKKTGSITDVYHWIGKEETQNLGETLLKIKETSSGAIDEFEKVQRVKKSTNEQFSKTKAGVETAIKEADRNIFTAIGEYVSLLSKLRSLRGDAISLKELRYVDLKAVDSFEKQLAEKTSMVSEKCVAFLLEEGSLAPYEIKAAAQKEGIAKVSKVTEADELGKEIDDAGNELQMLIEVVGNLKIKDSTQTTRIIDDISNLYSSLNLVKSGLKNRRKELLGVEGVAEFNAQLKLVGQSVVNYLEVSDTPEKADAFLTKLMVQLQELEGKFADFDGFILEITEKRAEVYDAFESKKIQLIEARNKKASNLQSAADRILKGMQSRLAGFGTINEINGYFAGDLMVDKARDIIAQLLQTGDPVKADELQSRLKSIKEDAIRQLKDKKDLFVEGQNVIKFGRHNFNVNTQPLDLTTVHKNGKMYFHLTGTNFMEEIEDPEFLKTKEVWEQSVLSENREVYRGEYLAFLAFRNLEEMPKNEAEKYRDGTASLKDFLQNFMANRYSEAYTKGLHDADGLILLEALVALRHSIGLLRFESKARACAMIFWEKHLPADKKKLLENRIKGAGLILQAFPAYSGFGGIVEDIKTLIEGFAAISKLFPIETAREAAEYLFFEVCAGHAFVVSPEADSVYTGFLDFLNKAGMEEKFLASTESLTESVFDKAELIKNWVTAYIDTHLDKNSHSEYADEATALLLTGLYKAENVAQASVRKTLEGLSGDHQVLQEGKYLLDYNDFLRKMRAFEEISVPKFNAYTDLKKSLSELFKKKLRLHEFSPKVLTSFVRNKLIDEVYLPLVGDNLAKQIGAAGENKRTDLMGMLLLVSPPGYGKTTLMEYVAHRLGIVFMKINGPAIGHKVTSLDPAEAPNASARDEMEKLNLAFEMGDNVMIYLDDIQHCNPELLQKFISLCDGQRKIEGVYKGQTRTYDLRGKKVAVVMAGNPYTESGDKFQIPDMLANRADTYNLGDIIGDSEAAFKLSYIENALTSNPVLGKLAVKSQKDIYTLSRLAETGLREGADFEAHIGAEELEEYVEVLKKIMKVRDVILRVNMEYIRSAAQSDEYRTEPAFKMQGSYRNMNKIAAKTAAIMNEEELQSLIMSHYDNDAQTLTSGAEANLLKFKEINGLLTDPKEAARWEDIKKAFRKNNAARAFGGADQTAQIIAQMNELSTGIGAIGEAIRGGKK